MFNSQSFWAPALAVTLVACGARFTAHENDGTAAGSSNVADAGEPGVGGSGAAGTGPSWGSGGRNWGNGGWWSGNGGATAADCATLRQKYQATVEAARACDKAAPEQCSTTSVAQVVEGCGCPVPINTESADADATREAYQAYLDAKCEYRGPVCNIACPPFATAACLPSASSGGFVCVGSGLQK